MAALNDKGLARLHCAIHPSLSDVLNAYARDMGCTKTRIVVEALVYKLKRAKRWPPKPSPEAIELNKREARKIRKSDREVLREQSKPVIRQTAPGAKFGRKAVKPIGKGSKPIGRGGRPIPKKGSS